MVHISMAGALDNTTILCGVIKLEANQPVRFIKFWLSISEQEQQRRILARKHSPLTYWKFSENDENALSHYDRMSILKERVIDSDWHTVDYANKKRGIKNLLATLCDQLA